MNGVVDMKIDEKISLTLEEEYDLSKLEKDMEEWDNDPGEIYDTFEDFWRSLGIEKYNAI